jgi:NADH-quinone oxidoreductase subunit J
VYCAIWFGQTLLGTAGLFLLAGAQFLAVATVAVYAGAILVTFLFVLMLAQPEGRATYDRVSWEALLSAATGAVLVGILSMTVAGVLTAPASPGPLAIEAASEDAMAQNILAPEHVARLGGELFGRHLLAVEVAGTLLLAALIGAAIIVSQTKGNPSS